MLCIGFSLSAGRGHSRVSFRHACHAIFFAPLMRQPAEAAEPLLQQSCCTLYFARRRRTRRWRCHAIVIRCERRAAAYVTAGSERECRSRRVCADINRGYQRERHRRAFSTPVRKVEAQVSCEEEPQRDGALFSRRAER